MSGSSNTESLSAAAGFVGGRENLTLRRTVAMTDWEERYQAGDTPWNKGQAHPMLAGWLASEPMEGKIVVPGCGLGHDVRALAAAGAEVIGLDLAPSAIAAASRFPKAGHESFVQCDFFELPSTWERTFDGVFEHTCFCAILPEMRSEYAAAVTRLLKPGGRFHAIFFLNPDHDEEGPPYRCTREELDQLFAPTLEFISEINHFPTFPGREGQESGMIWRRKA